MKSIPLIYKIGFFVVIIFGIGALIFALLPKTTQQNSQQSPQTLVTQGAQPADQTNTQNSQNILENVASWTPSLPWTGQQHVSQDTAYGNLPGLEIDAKITSDQPSYPQFEQKDQLIKMGFAEDTNIAAGAPGASMWGYKRNVNNQTQIIVFSYTTDYPNVTPDQPIEFTCPCQMTLSAFLSDPFTPSQ